MMKAASAATSSSERLNFARERREGKRNSFVHSNKKKWVLFKKKKPVTPTHDDFEYFDLQLCHRTPKKGVGEEGRKTTEEFA